MAADPPPALPTAYLLCDDADALAGIVDALVAERIEIGAVRSVEPDAAIERPTLVLLTGAAAAGAFGAGGGVPDGAVLLADDAAAAALPPGLGALPWDSTASRSARLRALRGALRLAAAERARAVAERELEQSQDELNELRRIGMALMTERDPDQLLVEILVQAKRLTASDAGSLYLTERAADGTQVLRFKLSQNDSLPNLPLVEFTLPIDPRSIAGYAAHTLEPIVLADAYDTGDAAYAINRSFDERFGYRTKSMLVAPMVDHLGRVVGVLQLINRKDRPSSRIRDEASAAAHVLPYDERQLALVRSLAGQAAVSIENSRLYAQIEALFESFVKAAVTAIDQRDPTTAGHSVRVAALTVGMAEALDRAAERSHGGVRFSRAQIRELRYAAMLHDFGKVAVREAVLTKAKKLPPHLFERVEARFDLIRSTLELDFQRHRAELLLAGRPDQLQQAEQQYQQRLAELDEFHDTVRRANEPTLLVEAASAALDEIGARSFRTPSGTEHPYLTAEELHYLRIPRGTLDERERLEIESHVEQTYRFLQTIPWTEDLRELPRFAYAHHEKLNGGGYPRGIEEADIPVQARIMTIADIFDALTASDRPYKPALPAERALDILRHEARTGGVDAELVELLISSGIYRRIIETDWRAL